MDDRVPDFRLLRLRYRLSQERLAAAAGVSQTKLSRIERGVRDATPEEVAAISRGLIRLSRRRATQ